ncbi:hypothetical protein [Catelliglobosispora koreensis]|uniref:hypothetical protein n=1 Tax=Catelliglobosispora koreensis TaxID=129052 RepID=UPI000366A93D|nr:hypothetical protein [Catelliglobosispora koreensis]
MLALVSLAGAPSCWLSNAAIVVLMPSARQGDSELETGARLEWWTDSLNCLASMEVRLTVGRRVEGWATLAVTESDIDEGTLSFLLELEPLLTLRFPDNSQLAVKVRRLGNGQLALGS